MGSHTLTLSLQCPEQTRVFLKALPTGQLFRPNHVVSAVGVCQTLRLREFGNVWAVGANRKGDRPLTREFGWSNGRELLRGRCRLAVTASADRNDAAAARPVTAASPSADWLVPLAGVTVQALSGGDVPITSLWKGRRVVVAWTRHFGCLLCRKRAAELAELKDRFTAAGATLIVIGPGSIRQAQAFMDQTQFPGEVYADQQRLSYDAFGFTAGVTTVINPTSALRVLQASMQGYQQDWQLSLQPDTVVLGGWQQGGVLAAGPGSDELLFLFKDKEAGDEPDMKDILAAVNA